MALRSLARDLDLLGTVTGVAALVLFNFAWNMAPIVGWQTPYVIVCLVLGVSLVGVFFFVEIKHASAPLIPFDALRADVSFVLAMVACGWSCFGIWLYYLLQTLTVLQSASPLEIAAEFSPISVSGALAALCTGFLLHRFGPAYVMLGALTAFTTGAILSATLPIHQTYWAQVFVTTVIMPWGMDMSFPAATLILSNAVSREHQGVAASLVNTVVNYSISLSLGIAGTIEVNVNKGGMTQHDLQLGYRGGLYLAVGLAGLGMAIGIMFVARKKLLERGQQSTDAEEQT